MVAACLMCRSKAVEAMLVENFVVPLILPSGMLYVPGPGTLRRIDKSDSEGN